MDTKTLTAHVPVSLIEKLDKIADRLERSRAWVVKQALSHWIEREEERYYLTLEALKNVDDGKVVGHEEVSAWIQGLDKKGAQ